MKHWASYADLKEIDHELLNRAVDAARYYCFDAVNLVFVLSTTTSGMYGTWSISVSTDCTVYLNKKSPKGMGGHFNDALKAFIEDCEKNSNQAEKR